MKTMKTPMFILLMILFACENNNSENDQEIINVTEMDTEVANEIDDNLDASEEEMVNDFESAFDLFDVTSRAKSNDRSYDATTGYWTITRDVEFTREITRHRDDLTVNRTDDVDIDVKIMTRFNDDTGNAIQFPRINPDTVITILIDRESDIKLNTEVVVEYADGHVDQYKSKNRDKTANQSISMTRSNVEHVWDMTFSSNKTLDIEIIKNDSVRKVKATMAVTTSDLKIKKVRGLLDGRRTHIVSGEITRVIAFDNGRSYTVVGTFYDCESDGNTDGIKYIRNFYETGSDTAFKTVTVYCNLR